MEAALDSFDVDSVQDGRGSGVLLVSAVQSGSLECVKCLVSGGYGGVEAALAEAMKLSKQDIVDFLESKANCSTNSLLGPGSGDMA